MLRLHTFKEAALVSNHRIRQVELWFPNKVFTAQKWAGIHWIPAVDFEVETRGY